jgi:hypothetical protein
MGGIVWVMLWCDMAWGNGPGGGCHLPEQWTTVEATGVSLPLFTSREACQQDELNIINDQAAPIDAAGGPRPGDNRERSEPR